MFADAHTAEVKQEKNQDSDNRLASHHQNPEV